MNNFYPGDAYVFILRCGVKIDNLDEGGVLIEGDAKCRREKKACLIKILTVMYLSFLGL